MTDEATAVRNAVVIGAGPAGMGLLFAARQNGELADLIRGGLRIIERSDRVGAGEIGNYRIRSDSLADSFLKSIDLERLPSLRAILARPSGRQIDDQRGKPVALAAVAQLLCDAAAELRNYLKEHLEDPIETRTEALGAQQRADGTWTTRCRDADGKELSYTSRHLVLATGAYQPAGQLHSNRVGSQPLLPTYAGKTLQSGEFLNGAGGELFERLVGERGNAKIAIVGGSHSAMASARLCLTRLDAAQQPEAITVMHRGPLRLTYASPQAAREEGYREFTEQDICAKSGRVFPLAGFRSDSRDMLRQYWGLGGLTRDDRLRLVNTQTLTPVECDQILERADVIIAAFGYRPRALPLWDRQGRRFSLQAESGVRPLVDGVSQVLDAAATPIPGVFALGLSDGYPMAGAYGEPSFSGQANGLALWQSDIGAQIVSRISNR